ncbi:MAG TPA: hypothetical protein VKS99_09485, partial [Blastocatellia bacterium]|nr:hypothetical protein [Blastocatellia bacterium]
MSRNNAVDRQFARLLAPLVVLFASVIQCAAQSQDQAGTAQKATGKDEFMACPSTVLVVYIDVEVKDRKGNAVPNLSRKNFRVYEDGVPQEVSALMQVGAQSDGKYTLLYYPTNIRFDGLRRKVQVGTRANEWRKLRVSFQLRPDPKNELGLKVSVYPQGYS